MYETKQCKIPVSRLYRKNSRKSDIYNGSLTYPSFHSDNNGRTIIQKMIDVIQTDKNIGLGFSDLVNKSINQADIFGKQTDSKNNLLYFRTEIGANAPTDFVKGVSDKRVNGKIQAIFTNGIKKAMKDSLTINQNLSGFTPNQVNHAREHAPILNDDEEEAAKQGTPSYRDYSPLSAELWYAMKDAEPEEKKWSLDISAISVWELSHLLHNRELFNKTKFYCYNKADPTPNVQPLTKDAIKQYGIKLNEQDVKSLNELGFDVSAEDQGGNWFMRIFCNCFQ